MSLGVGAVTPIGRSTWRLFAAAVALCLIAVAFRYLVVEWRPVALQCDVAVPPVWCAARHFVIELFYSDVVGIASLAGAALSLLLYRQRGSRFIAAVALLLGAPAVVLYSADEAVPAVLLAMLRLLRDERGA
ncbi:MAG: hypothetical protein ACK4NA_12245 [Alphaproteobacteria bacterium]